MQIEPPRQRKELRRWRQSWKKILPWCSCRHHYRPCATNNPPHTYSIPNTTATTHSHNKYTCTAAPTPTAGVPSNNKKEGQTRNRPTQRNWGQPRLGPKGPKMLSVERDNTQEYTEDRDQGFQPHHGSNRNLRVLREGVTPIQ